MRDPRMLNGVYIEVFVKGHAIVITDPRTLCQPELRAFGLRFSYAV